MRPCPAGLPRLLAAFGLGLLVGAGAGCSSPGQQAQADLVVDSNRNGLLEPGVADEDEGEDRWDAAHGAVLLANLDDDDGDGRADAEDDVVNGPRDIEDLTPVVLRAWPEAPAGAFATLALDEGSLGHVRVFLVDGPEADPASYREIDARSFELDAAVLRSGARLALEGRDVVRNREPGAFSGRAQLTARVESSRGGSLTGTGVAEDRIEVHLAPVLFQHNLLPTKKVFYTWGDDASATLQAGLEQAAEGTEVEVVPLDLENDYDQWTQDFFEVGHMTRPGPGGRPVGMSVFVRATQADRDAGQWVMDNLLGPDAAVLSVRDEETQPADLAWTLSSFGNFEVIPPHVAPDGTSYPAGRNYFGQGTARNARPDAVFTEFLGAQSVQAPVAIDTTFLLVGHVDEITSFVPSRSARGWAMLVADPMRARAILADVATRNSAAGGDGAGSRGVRMFEGRSWIDYSVQQVREVPAAISVEDVLADADLMAASQAADVQIRKARQLLQDEIGLEDWEIVPMPFLLERTYGGLVAYQPGTVNLLHFDGRVVVPDPFGPRVGGVDPFRSDIEERLGKLGLQVTFADVWDTYHRNDGEVHCASNVERRMELPWWESGR